MSTGIVQLSEILPRPGPCPVVCLGLGMLGAFHHWKYCQNLFLAFPVGTNKFPSMPNVSLTITLPEVVAAEVLQTARAQYLSRSAVLRQIILRELDKLREETAGGDRGE